VTAVSPAAQAELLEATNDSIEDAVGYADPMVLRGLLHQLTGDPSLAEMRLVTAPFGRLEALVPRDQADVTALRAKAADLLKSYRDRGGGEVKIGPIERLPRSLSLTAGVQLADTELEMWLEQAALDPWARGLIWEHEPSAEQLEGFTVAIIGAGMGGLNAAVLLGHAGVRYVVIEKNSGVGGTWYENRYPGARVDSPSRCYTHVYGVGFEFPNPFCEQPENERYYNWMADTFGVRDHIEFDTEVRSLTWDADAAMWEIRAEGPHGSREWRANVVISAVGFLSRPALPEIEGLDEFQGSAFHTARWPKGLSLDGKRIAVVGSGCSGYQLVPEVAKLAAHTYLFQRTPSWCFGVKGYLAPHPPQTLWLDRNLPFHRNFARFRMSHLFGPDTLAPLKKVDPNFDDPHTLSALNKRIRDERIAFMREKFEGRPDLLENMLPVAPPWSSRPVIVDDEDSVYDALLRDNVTLVSGGVVRLTREGVVAADGSDYPVDVIAFATGFKASDYLWPMEIRGRNGLRLEDLWSKDGPRAYLGAMVPGFPNFFMVYGPNTNPSGGLGVVELEELVTRFALECIRGLIEQDRRSVDVTPDAYWRYNDELDDWEATTPYKDPRVKTYYTNEFGRSPTNSPIDVRRMWAWLRSPIGPRPNVQVPPSGSSACRAHELRTYFGEDLVVD
jgi:4-hydroxyacetophenone monooxygenase